MREKWIVLDRSRLIRMSNVKEIFVHDLDFTIHIVMKDGPVHEIFEMPLDFAYQGEMLKLDANDAYFVLISVIEHITLSESIIIDPKSMRFFAGLMQYFLINRREMIDDEECDAEEGS